jgi:hypothetical protein
VSDKKRGHPSVFTPEQNEAMRQEVRRWREQEANTKLSQEAVAERLHMGQQSFSSFMRGDTGLGYLSGTMLAQLVGYMGVDELFRTHNVAHPGPVGRQNDVFPRRETTARNLIATNRISTATYDAVRTDPKWNTHDMVWREHVFWEGVLEATERERQQQIIAAAPEQKREQRRAVAADAHRRERRRRKAG